MFHWADYVVLVLFLLVSAGIGFFVAFKSRQRTTDDYLMGGRRLNWFPVAISIWVTLMSAVSVLGTPLEIYLNGVGFFLLVLAFFLVVPIVAHVFVPFFFKLRLTSIYEYLELRFNRTIRLLGAIVFCLQMVFYMAIVLYAPALALSQVTQLSMWISILGIGIVCTVYTSLGGLRAVVYTDTFQAFIIVVGALTLIIKTVVDVGGVAEVWRRAEEGGRLDNFINFDADPRTRHTVWGLAIGGATTTLSLYGVNQVVVQRYLAVKHLRHAQATVYINLPATIVSITLFVALGLVAYARYFRCDPFITGRIQAFDQLIPLMVVDQLGVLPGLPGLFVACVFSASLSTVSSGVNALALVYLEDGVKPVYSSFAKTDMTERRAMIVTKCLATLFGLVTIGLANLMRLMNQTLVNITIKTQGMTGGPLLGLFVLAIFFPTANSWGAGVGLLCGLSFSFWLGVGAIMDGPRISVLPLTPINCSITAAAAAATTTTSGDSVGNLTSSTLTSTSASYVDTTLTSLMNSTSHPPASSPPLSSGYDGLSLYELSYLWYGLASTLVVIIIGLIVSFLTGFGEKQELNPNHYIPVWDTLKSCFIKHKKRYSVWRSQKKQGDTKTPKDYKMYPETG